MLFILFATLFVSAIAGPVGSFQDADPADDTFLGLAWHAAAGEVNEGKEGKFYVPKEVQSAKVNEGKDGKITQLDVLYQESWCSPEDGNDLSDVCESMCPLYYGGAQAVYHVTVTENANGDEKTVVEKVREVENIAEH